MQFCFVSITTFALTFYPEDFFFSGGNLALENNETTMEAHQSEGMSFRDIFHYYQLLIAQSIYLSGKKKFQK